MADPITSDLKSGALVYHRLPRKARDPGDQAARQPARSRAGLFARRRRRLRGDPTIPARPPTYTIRANLVAVISNGTAVLGLGNIGPLASKPVMEGKAVLFKKFAGIDVFDIEVDERDVDKLVEVCGAGADLRRHQPRGHQGAGVFRGRGSQLRERMNIPGLPRRPARHRHHRRRRGAQRARSRRQEDRRGEDRHLRRRRGGARLPQPARRAGRRRENIWVADLDGVVYKGRNSLMDRWKAVLRAGHRQDARWPR
jgi:malate dehydrogenase (oxaloacetate-decarboxylating)(NADP+)